MSINNTLHEVKFHIGGYKLYIFIYIHQFLFDIQLYSGLNLGWLCDKLNIGLEYLRLLISTAKADNSVLPRTEYCDPTILCHNAVGSWS